MFCMQCFQYILETLFANTMMLLVLHVSPNAVTDFTVKTVAFVFFLGLNL